MRDPDGGMPRISVNTSLQIEPPICGTMAASHSAIAAARPRRTAPRDDRARARRRETSVVAARRPWTFTIEALGVRCAMQGRHDRVGSVPATKRNGRWTTPTVGMALKCRPGVPVVKASTLKTLLHRRAQGRRQPLLAPTRDRLPVRCRHRRISTSVRAALSAADMAVPQRGHQQTGLYGPDDC
jgi:hypothetical protein